MTAPAGFVRSTDKFNVTASIAGFLILAGTFYLRTKNNLVDPYYTVGCVLGAGMIAPTIIYDLIQKWRKENL